MVCNCKTCKHNYRRACLCEADEDQIEQAVDDFENFDYVMFDACIDIGEDGRCASFEKKEK